MDTKSILRRDAGSIGIGILLVIGLYLTSLHSYLLFHSVVELFTIIVASGVFVIAWNARAYLNNNYLLFVAIASVFVALIDLIHTLGYEGMGVFPGDTANLATQLWIAARYLQSASWLSAPLLLRRKLRPGLQVVVYAAITGLILLSILDWRVFPVCFVPGTGLTPFKVVSEYLICLIFLGAIVLLDRNRREFDPMVTQLLVISLGLGIAGEIAFTSYVSVYGGANMIGHMLRLGGAYFLYKAIIETALAKPYAILLRDLKNSDDQLREYADTLRAQNEDLVRIQNQLRAEGTKLKTQNDELDAFAHTVAHDLKSPLATMIVAADVVNTVTNLTHKEQRETLQQIKATAFDMDNIVDSLLLLSEVRKAEVPSQPVEMAQVVAAVHKRLNYAIKERHGRLVYPKAWPTALGYGPWVEEVWANYISNALKYGGTSPCVELGADRQPDGMIRFWVRDDGPGIAPEDQAGLFTPFTQRRKAHTSGHGLGLSIVLRIVQKLGGKVGVESANGRGTRFYFTLPEAPTANKAARPARGTVEPAR